MWTFGTLDRRTPGAGFLGLLNATAYFAWLVAASGLLTYAGGWSGLDARWAIACVAIVGSLFALIGRSILEERVASDFAIGCAVGIQASLATVSLWALKDHLQAILLVVAAAQLTTVRRRLPVLFALALANCALLAWLVLNQPLVKAIQVGLAYIAFQLFAAFVTQAAYAAQESRRDVLRTNRELLAARALVAEGARAQERLRLSRELHDIAGHKLTALKLQLAVEMRSKSATASSTLPQCLTLADELLNEIRMVVSALRQQDAIDLQTALLALDPAIATVSVKFNVDENAIVSDIDRAETLLRCAQEGLTNALRHGAATEIAITLLRDERDLVLCVDDNGVGYQGANQSMGNGLRGLQERLEDFQGMVSLHPRHPRGCTMRVVLPEAFAT